MSAVSFLVLAILTLLVLILIVKGLLKTEAMIATVVHYTKERMASDSRKMSKKALRQCVV